MSAISAFISLIQLLVALTHLRRELNDKHSNYLLLTYRTAIQPVPAAVWIASARLTRSRVRLCCLLLNHWLHLSIQLSPAQETLKYAGDVERTVGPVDILRFSHRRELVGHWALVQDPVL